MDKLQEMIDPFMQTIGTNMLPFFSALGLLILGWLVALAISAGLRATLKKIGINERFVKPATEGEKTKVYDVERWISKGVFYLLMILVLVGFFQILGLTIITEPLNTLLNRVLQWVPGLVGAAILLMFAWILANLIRFFVTRALTVFKIDQRLGDQAGVELKDAKTLTQTIGEVVYWLIFLLFLPAILGSLSLEGLLEPVRDMTDQILQFLPNIFAAILIIAVGWFIARIIQRVVSNFLAAVGSEKLSEQVGLSAVLGKQSLSNLIGLVIYILILIPVLIAGLRALRLTVITDPATNMLNQFLSALPRIFAALVLLVIAYVAGKIVSGLIKNLLTNLGFNDFLKRIGLSKQIVEGQKTASEIAGYLFLVAVMFFAAIEALRLLEYGVLAQLISDFLVMAGHILLGLVIFVIGLYLANLAQKAIQASGTSQARLLSLISRVAILILAGAMALRQMGLANEIINLAFGILFGGCAIAVALAFGLGGKDFVTREIDQWLKDIIPGKKDEKLKD
ncbi:mechanosensitive ion channel [bacterium]|nr:mechanosensitive ion channel [bacterium]